MASRNPEDVTLGTLHEALLDLKTTLIAGFRSLPSRESSEEMVRLLREGNRLQEERFSQLDVRIREQHLETQQVLHALAENQRFLSDAVQNLASQVSSLASEVSSLASEVSSLASEVRSVASEVRGLSSDIKALIARLDALIKGREDGGPAA